MKKTLALLLPLVLLASAVSCSQNSSISSSSSDGNGSVTQNAASPEDGTNYKKSTLNDNILTNEYADITMEIPSDMHLATAEELGNLTINTVSYYTDEKNIAYETGTIWDSWITSNVDNIFYRFVNTKIAFPNTSEPTPDDVLDVFKERNEGSGADYLERTNVKLGNEEYRREVYNYAATEYEPPHLNYLYARKIDDDIIVLISVASTNEERTPDFFEALFK